MQVASLRISSVVGGRSLVPLSKVILKRNIISPLSATYNRCLFSTEVVKNEKQYTSFQKNMASLKAQWTLAKTAFQDMGSDKKYLVAAFSLSPVMWAVSGFSTFHGWGLPWWGSIMAFTFGIRLCLLPLQIKSMKSQGKMTKMQPELDKLMDKMKIAALNGEKDMTPYQLETRNLYKEYGVSPMAMAGSAFVQLPVILCLFWGLEKLVKTDASLITGGCLWFPNLTIPDPYYVIPIVANLILYLSTANMASKPGSNMKNMSRAMILVSTLITVRFSSAFALLLATTSLYQTVTDGILRTTPIKKLLNIPIEQVEKIETQFDIKDIPPPPTMEIHKKNKENNKETTQQN
ncbi:hypothetical protein WA158_006245 [Blastocystis sp. Blastoise]